MLTENEKYIVEETEKFVKKVLYKAEGGHDWWHIHRVRNLSLKIAKGEGADEFVVELAALLHDIADPKFHDGNEEIGPEMAKSFLKSINVENYIIDHIENIIRNISFKNSFDEINFNSKELEIVQDADRIDAIGAIGIARTFNYGGHIGTEIYNPDIKPVKFKSKEEYKKTKAPTINHFYEKLLLLKDKMNTKTALKIAEERHNFMLQFLNQFYEEWG
ncbi:MAG: phosphohydrolase [Marinilabiliales bacterium]|nr:MAG: phosphohydrolase [Marinilabiliales bacterium]